jgi:L-ascorbate metabolism protein UlaG (beta-lactamase superfamily)
MLKIKYFAHACFMIENDKEKVIIDPYDISMGYEPVKETVNYLLVSHNHYDHNYINDIKLEDNIGSFKIDKIKSYHDEENGKLRGENIIHVIDDGNVRICHLGDLGHILREEQIKLIGTIDVLLIPVGGVFTIDYIQAIDVVKQLNPNVVIPMHYKTDKWGYNKGVDSIDNFIKNIKGYKIVKLDNNEINYTKSLEKIIYII